MADRAALVDVAQKLAAGTGPVAVDAERASGFRYSQRAYLVQLRRAGAGTALIDPIPLGSDLRELAPVLAGPEWVLHAASQDLPCLAEVGLAPASLFDTELAGRLAGLPRVGLGPLVEQLLGLSLEKGHGAADWSRRPLPDDWLVYAALDVEVLVELRDVLAELLAEQGKLEWARQEFEAVRTAGPPAPRAEPWRRTSGIHKIRKPRALAAVRALWEARDRLAAERDIAPGRVLPDAAIVDAAVVAPTSPAALAALPVFRGRSQRRLTSYWYAALAQAARLDPDAAPDGDGPERRTPARRALGRPRPGRGRPALGGPRGHRGAVGESGRSRRRTCCSPTSCAASAGPRPRTATSPRRCGEGGAREWQVGLIAPLLADLARPVA